LCVFAAFAAFTGYACAHAEPVGPSFDVQPYAVAPVSYGFDPTLVLESMPMKSPFGMWAFPVFATVRAVSDTYPAQGIFGRAWSLNWGSVGYAAFHVNDSDAASSMKVTGVSRGFFTDLLTCASFEATIVSQVRPILASLRVGKVALGVAGEALRVPSVNVSVDYGVAAVDTANLLVLGALNVTAGGFVNIRGADDGLDFVSADSVCLTSEWGSVHARVRVKSAASIYAGRDALVVLAPGAAEEGMPVSYSVSAWRKAVVEVHAFTGNFNLSASVSAVSALSCVSGSDPNCPDTIVYSTEAECDVYDEDDSIAVCLVEGYVFGTAICRQTGVCVNSTLSADAGRVVVRFGGGDH